MARRLNRLVSIVLSSALILLSLGFDAQQAAAQTLTGRAAPVSPTPQLGLSLGGAPAPVSNMPVLSLSAPALSAPAAALAAPAIVTSVAAQPVALKPATPAAQIAQSLRAAAPALQALAKPETGGSAASAAGRDLENVLTGAKTSGSGELSDAVAGVPSALTPSLAAASAAPEAPKAPVVPAAAPAPFKTIASASSYSVHRLALKAVAAFTGAVFSLPQASPALTAKIIASAADKQLVLSDFDDTLAGYNEVLPAQKVDAIRKIRAAGKHFAVISDRGDVKRPGQAQLTVFESLESIPAADRAGMYVAANSGGKVYRFDENGVPQKVHEAPALEAAKLDSVKAAAAATKARLAEVGAVQHAGDEKVPAESFSTYGYAMMFKPGSSEAAVRGAAAILGEELAKRGFEVEVNPRFAKDPANPPYVTFSIITKADAAEYIAKALKIEAHDALVIGDAMFVPRDAKKEGWVTRLGARLSGRPQTKTGNETDRNMTKKLPGVLALGVGAAMDPRVPNGWALDGKGPEVTQKVLESVASKPAKLDGEDKTGTWIQLGLLGLVIGAAALGYYALINAIGDIFRLGEEAARNWSHGPFGLDAGMFLGATTLGMVGMLGYNRPASLANPADTYALALKRATELAKELGVSADQVRFVEATAGMPVRDGAQWHFTFSVPSRKGPADLIYVDFGTFLGGAQDMRSSVYVGVPAPSGVTPVALDAAKFSELVALAPSHALLALRDKLPGVSGGVSVSLAARAAADGDGSQMTYKFYDDHGSEGTVGAAGAFVRVDKMSAVAQKAAAKIVPAGLTHAVEPNALYALALEKMRAKAAALGAAPDKIRFYSAVHEARTFNGAWVGDEWRFFFGVMGASYMVPARRTMVSETMMDAFEPELKGPFTSDDRMSSIPADAFEQIVTLGPDAALKEISGTTRVSLFMQGGEFKYSLQNAAEELGTMGARTGVIVKSKERSENAESNVASFLLWLGGVSLVALIYGAFYWAMAHAPAAAPQGLQDGYHGPVPSLEDVFRGMSGTLGMAGIIAAGVLGGGSKRVRKAKVTDDEVRSAAAGAISYKGRPWSQTEYNMGYYNALESLKSRGATEAQLALFEKLCADAPIKGGSFNPWSGD